LQPNLRPIEKEVLFDLDQGSGLGSECNELAHTRALSGIDRAALLLLGVSRR
jgi:hypothetical protein